MYIFGLIILTFFAVIGLTVFINEIVRSGHEDDKMTLTLTSLTAGDAEIRVRRAARICSDIRCSRLLCQCDDVTAIEICETLRADYPVIEIQAKVD